MTVHVQRGPIRPLIGRFVVPLQRGGRETLVDSYDGQPIAVGLEVSHRTTRRTARPVACYFPGPDHVESDRVT